MSEHPAPPPDHEAAFLAWMEDEHRRREAARRRQYLARLEWMQLATYGMMFFWTALMFVGFRTRPDLVPADMAGIVTAVALFGGALIVWHLARLKRQTRRHLEALAEDDTENGE